MYWRSPKSLIRSGACWNYGVWYNSRQLEKTIRVQVLLSGPWFFLALARIQRRVEQRKALERDDSGLGADPRPLRPQSLPPPDRGVGFGV